MTELVYFEEFDDIHEAIDRETQLKRLTRRQKIKLIESINPQWRDLSESETMADRDSSRAPDNADARGNDTQRKSS